MPHLPPLRLTGALVLRDNRLEKDEISIANRQICDGPFSEIDLSGYYILPGIIDLHGDGFERHLQPRQNVYIDKLIGLKNADAELAANGVTTAIFAQCWSWLGGRRGPEYATELLKAWSGYKAQSLVDIQFQLRYETHMITPASALLQTLLDFGVNYLVFNNHINDAANAQATAPLGFAGYAAEAGRTPRQHAVILEKMLGNAFKVDDSLKQISKTLAEHGVRLGSHDDKTASTRSYFADLGADICEFPTTLEAAEQAKTLGNPILMGAPNIMRGGSQSASIGAQGLVEAGLCDALVSDYYYPALQAAAWALADKGVLPFERAWALISSNPAKILGLDDRGRLDTGARADLVVLNPETRVIEATISNGRLAALSGKAGVRFARSGAALSIAAE